MIDFKKLTTVRLYNYYKAERKRMYCKYTHTIVDEDQNGEPIMGFENTWNDPMFDENIKRLNDIKNELRLRENIK